MTDDIPVVAYLAHALLAERERLGEVNPQFGYYERLFWIAVHSGNVEELKRLHDHVNSRGGTFAGL